MLSIDRLSFCPPRVAAAPALPFCRPQARARAQMQQQERTWRRAKRAATAVVKGQRREASQQRRQRQGARASLACGRCAPALHATPGQAVLAVQNPRSSDARARSAHSARLSASPLPRASWWC